MLLDESHHHGDFRDGFVRSGPVGLVDHENVADLHDAGLDRLNVVAHPRDEHDHVRLNGANDLDFVLADADGFDEDDVESGGVEEIDDIVRGFGEPAHETASCHRADENAAIGVQLSHTNAIAENCAAAEGRSRIDSDDSNSLVLPPIKLRKRRDQRRLPRAGRTGDADDAGFASGCVKFREQFFSGWIGALNERDGFGEGAVVAGANALCQFIPHLSAPHPSDKRCLAITIL